jgi:NADH-quinone oxidoreductase subunit M
MNTRELGYLIPIVIMMFWMGIYPQTFLRKMDASVESYIHRITSRQKIFIQNSLPQTLPAAAPDKERGRR